MKTKFEISLRDAVNAIASLEDIQNNYPDETGWDATNVFVVETPTDEDGNDENFDMHQGIVEDVQEALSGFEFWVTDED